MKNFKKNLITAAFLAVLTISASLFTASNFLVQTAVAQTTGGGVGGGPQDGGDGKKKKCRPPRQCPTGGGGSGQGRPDSTESNGTDGSESSDWWDDIIDWLFGE
jgi:uncharacterized membrane protein